MNDSFGIILGVIIGSFLSYVFSRKESKDKFSANLFMEYKNISQELADIFKELQLQSLMPLTVHKGIRDKIDKELAMFLYKYYLVLPQAVIEEINCLHECLLCNGSSIFMVKQVYGLPEIQKRTTDKDVKDLLESVALIQVDGRSLFDIYNQYKRLPNSIFLKCQARHVIFVMHDCWNLSNIHKWKKQLTKMTIAQRKKKLKRKVRSTPAALLKNRTVEK